MSYIPKEGEIVSYRVESPAQGVCSGSGVVMRVEATGGGNWRVRVRTDRMNEVDEPITWSLFSTSTTFTPLQKLAWFNKGEGVEVAQFGNQEFLICETDEGVKAYVDDSYEALRRTLDAARSFCEKVAFGLIEKRPIVPIVEASV